VPYRYESASMTKTSAGNFFEDFRLGQSIRHATPRTITAGEIALYGGLFGARFAVQSANAFAQAIGYRERPVDDWLVFHMVFGKTVPDISLNAVANLGYAGGQFLAPVFVGDTLSAVSEVIGLKENSSRKTGVVYVRTRGCRQDDTLVLEYVRWVMVNKRDPAAAAPGDHVPRLPTAVDAKLIGAACPPIDVKAYDFALAGSPQRFDDYQIGEKIDHVDGATVEEAEHQIATRLYQNTARNLARPCAVVQRARQRLPRRRHQRRPACRAAVRGLHRVCLVRGAGEKRIARTQRCRRAAAAHRRDARPAVRGFSVQGRRGI
jgi:2-methylfumaryl-CoA hydratase